LIFFLKFNKGYKARGKLTYISHLDPFSCYNSTSSKETNFNQGRPCVVKFIARRNAPELTFASRNNRSRQDGQEGRRVETQSLVPVSNRAKSRWSPLEGNRPF